MVGAGSARLRGELPRWGLEADDDGRDLLSGHLVAYTGGVKETPGVSGPKALGGSRLQLMNFGLGSSTRPDNA